MINKGVTEEDRCDHPGRTRKRLEQAQALFHAGPAHRNDEDVQGDGAAGARNPGRGKAIRRRMVDLNVSA